MADMLSLKQAIALFGRIKPEDLDAYVTVALVDKWGDDPNWQELEATGHGEEFIHDFITALTVKAHRLKKEGEDNSEQKATIQELLELLEFGPQEYEFGPGGRLEDIGREKKFRVGSKELSRALRWEVQRQLRDDSPGQSESNVQVAERIRPEARAALIQRGLLKPESDYPSIDMLRRLVGRLR